MRQRAAEELSMQTELCLFRNYQKYVGSHSGAERLPDVRLRAHRLREFGRLRSELVVVVGTLREPSECN